jgi:predicted PurR-regulated permease PerM
MDAAELLGEHMSEYAKELERDRRLATLLMDVIIRASVIFILAALCFRVFAPFLVLMVWSLILAITLYPLQGMLATRMGGRQGLAATVIAILAIALIVAPAAVLLNSIGDSVQGLIDNVREGTFEVPAPPASVAALPIVGERINGYWQQAHDDLPALVHSLQPKIGEFAKSALLMVASIGGGILELVAALIVAAIMMAFGDSGARAIRAIFKRLAGVERGTQLAELSGATIRAVALGVVGVAFIQAMLVGLSLLVAGVPWAGVLAGIVLVLAIAQIPAAIVILPAIAYIWLSGNYGNGAAIGYTVLLLVAGLADNVLKPLMLGRGVDAPMPLILIGALGGMAARGIVGMFVGAVLLALGYRLVQGWVAMSAEERRFVAPATEGAETAGRRESAVP